MKLESLLKKVNDGTLCSDETFRDYEEVIDARDEAEFETPWLDCSKRLEAVSLNPEELQELTKLRELTFKATYRATRDPDICAAVSDDFELIGKAVYADESFPFVNGLLVLYQQQKFPAGHIDPVDADIRDLL